MRLIRNLQNLVLVALLLVAAITNASAHYIDGFLAQCTTTGTGTCVESTAVGYARQPIWFGIPVKGVSPNQVGYTFGPSGVGSVAGHAVYTLPTGGVLILVMPYAAPVTFSGGALDRGDVGAMLLTITALTSFGDSSFYAGAVNATTAFGTTNAGGVLYSGVALTIARGILSPP